MNYSELVHFSIEMLISMTKQKLITLKKKLKKALSSRLNYAGLIGM